ncbi:MAG: hypothetical protein ACJ75Q_10995 [Gaiellaceae bacterium]
MKTSVMELGGWSVLIELVEKNPTTTSPAAVVLTDGATNERLLGVNAPLCESTGEAEAMPLKSRIDPPRGEGEDTDQR